MRDDAGRLRVVQAMGSDDDTQLALPGLGGEHAPDAPAVQNKKWCGPLESPGAWSSTQPSAPGWYWSGRGPAEATVVCLFKPWDDDDALWVAMIGRREAPLRDAGLSDCYWAGPLAPPCGDSPGA
jgi:hypothetical protein